MAVYSSLFRHLCEIIKTYVNSDGTIRKVTPSLRGVGITDAHTCIQIDRNMFAFMHLSGNYQIILPQKK